MITISQLIEYLQDVQHEVGEDAEVRVAHQPQWAFEYSLDDRVGVADGVVYLAEGTQVGYLPHKASVAVGWSEEDYDEEEDYPEDEEPEERIIDY
jgi:hypothetical protein